MVDALFKEVKKRGKNLNVSLYTKLGKLHLQKLFNEYADRYGVKFKDRSDSDEIVESNEESMSPRDILNYINDLHEFGYEESEYEDWEWISKFDIYRLENVKLSDLKISALHPPVAKKYSLLETDIPPIVVDSESKFILDGNHRAKGAEFRGDEYIQAYVGYKNIKEEYESNGRTYTLAYHGTPNGGFDTFSYDYRGSGADTHSVGDYGKGFYFTPYKEHALAYAHGLTEEGKGKNPYLYTVELDMKKPFDLTVLDRYRNLMLPLMKEYGVMNIPDEDYNNVFNQLGITEDEYHYMLDIEDQIGDNLGDWDFEEILGEEGYDSIISHAGKEYIVFKPEQIKIVDKQPV